MNNYEAAQQEFKQLIDTTLVLAEELLPPDLAQNVLPHIKVDYCQPQAEYLAICISSNTEFF